MDEIVRYSRVMLSTDLISELVVEPRVNGAVEFKVAVIESARGPIALLPAELDLYDD